MDFASPFWPQLNLCLKFYPILAISLIDVTSCFFSNRFSCVPNEIRRDPNEVIDVLIVRIGGLWWPFLSLFQMHIWPLNWFNARKRFLYNPKWNKACCARCCERSQAIIHISLNLPTIDVSILSFHAWNQFGDCGSRARQVCLGVLALVKPGAVNHIYLRTYMRESSVFKPITISDQEVNSLWSWKSIWPICQWQIWHYSQNHPD